MKPHEHIILEIARECERQMIEEGWTPEHDDTHDRGELAAAAAFGTVPEEYLAALRAENERLREALTKIAKRDEQIIHGDDDEERAARAEMTEIAIAALNKRGDHDR